jgi:eukaryotic-like serine/threonine-protein kinase
LGRPLTGRPPFLGESQLETLRLVASTEPVAPSQSRPDIPRDVETICLKCLQKEPARRFASASALADDLRRFQEGRPIVARPVRLWERSWRWCRRNPRFAAVWTLLAATILIAISIFIGLTYRHNVQLRAEVKRTADKAAEASRNYQEARSTIQAMLARLKDRRFEGTPRMKELGLDQMEDALSFYNRILRQNVSNDPAVRSDTARAFGLLSTVQRDFGRSDQAEQQVRQALDLIEGLRSEHPEDVDYLGLKVECLNRLSHYLNDLGRPDQAIEAGKEAVRLVEVLAPATPDNLAHQEMVAVCHDTYATTLRGLRRFSDAREHYRKAIETRQGLDFSKSPGWAQRHAETLMNDGVTLWNMNQFLQAEARFREVEELMLAVPPEVRNNVSLGLLYVNWSGVLIYLNRFQESVDRANAGLSLVEAYLRIEPNDAIARDVCLKLHGNQGLALSASGKHGESADQWKRVLELSSESVPPGPRVRLALERLYAGQRDQALKEAQPVQPAPDIADEDRYNLGCLFSLGAAAAREDLSISPDKRAKLVKSHIVDSLRWLKSASEAGFFRNPANCDHAKKDPDLEILRDCPEFRQLMELPAAKPANNGK